MSNTNQNIFKETVETLISDAKSLQKKFTALQEKNDFRGALDTMRLLKDTLSLIKEYDWKLMYSEYETDGHKEIAVWEQNHCGEIKRHKKWRVVPQGKEDTNRWSKMFEDYIISGKSHLYCNGKHHRGTGKSYALASLCDKYNGCIVVDKNRHLATGIDNNCKLFDFKTTIITYKDAMALRQYRNKIFFIDEGSGLSQEQLDKLMENHIVIGFSN
ncbi:hypothetical protein [Konateibacter massiliensis]|uniref:hypothetical protein n=1 Tax=Konateibacter massiliensis TaxID=2002841 RepID=UPI000C14D30D|nr:hypothetical protein [Konateibacter massiliensis]